MKNSETLKFKENLFLVFFIFSLALVAYGKFLAQSQVVLPSNSPALRINHTVLEFPSPPPDVTAISYLVGEVNSSTILAQRNARLHLYPASISKLMTAMIVIDNLDLNQVVKISDYAVSAEGNEGGLVAQEKIRVKDLLKILLLSSSNDAALAFSEILQQQGKNPTALLEQKIEKLGLKNTAFFDFTGLDRLGNFSTAEDLFILSQEIYRHYPLVGEITRKKKDVVVSVDKMQKHFLTNTNSLAGEIKELWGGKTGSTPVARDCLLTIYEFPFNDKNDKIVISIIVLGSKDRAGDTKKLYSWVKDSIYW